MKSTAVLFALLVAVLAMPSLANAQSNSKKNKATVEKTAPATVPADQQAPPEKAIVHDKNSGAYLQSVGRRVAARPLACPGGRRRG